MRTGIRISMRSSTGTRIRISASMHVGVQVKPAPPSCKVASARVSVQARVSVRASIRRSVGVSIWRSFDIEELSENRQAGREDEAYSLKLKLEDGW